MNNETGARTIGCAGPARSERRTACRLSAALGMLLSAVCLLFASAPQAGADAPAGGDVAVAQTLGDRELTVILRRVTAVPGPLHVDIITHTGTPAGRIQLQAVATGGSVDTAAAAGTGNPASSAVVRLGATPGPYAASMQIPRAGPWELRLGDGQHTAKIPFIVPNQAASPPEVLAFAGFIAAGVLMLVTVLAAVRAVHRRWTMISAGGMITAMVIAVTSALLSARLPLPPDAGQQVDPTIDNVTDPYAHMRPLSSDYSRPSASLMLHLSEGHTTKANNLQLTLTDGATGLPVDDLVVHDGALMHLLVISPTGELQHLHPVVTGPGELAVALRLREPGHYAVSAEIARRGGGVQQLRSTTGLDIHGATEHQRVGTSPPPGLGSRSVGGTPVHLSASSLKSGTASVLTAHIGKSATLQPWLGMVGHMIVVGPLPRDTAQVGERAETAQIWSHAHSMGGMASGSSDGMKGGGMDMDGMDMAMPPRSGTHASGSMSGLVPVNGDSAVDETVAAYGPDVPFVYTFPAPGYYRIWIQVERDYTILTVPAEVYVGSRTGGKS